MSKRLGNAVDPFGIIQQYGSDPLRWYMITNANPWENIRFDPKGVEEVSRKYFGTLYNTGLLYTSAFFRSLLCAVRSLRCRSHGLSPFI